MSYFASECYSFDFSSSEFQESHDKCYKLSIETKSWTYLATMAFKRREAAGAEVQGKLFITGGSYGNNYHSSTEYITVEGEVLPGPNLPSPPRSFHCMMKLPSGKLVITGIDVAFFSGGVKSDLLEC